MPARARSTRCARCSRSSAPAVRASSGTVSLRPERTGAIDWTPCNNVQCATLSVPLDYAHPERQQITLALARRPASHKRRRRAVHQSRRPRRFRRGLPARRARSVFARASSTRSTSCRGIHAASATRAGASAATISTSSTPSTAIRTTPAAVAANVRSTRDVRRGVQASSARRCCRSSRPRETVHDMDAIRAAIGEPTDHLLRVLVRHVPRRALRRRVPDSTCARWCSTARSIPRSAVRRRRDRPGEGFRATSSTRSSTWCRVARGLRLRGRRRSRGRVRHAGTRRSPGDRFPRGRRRARTLGPGEFDIGVASALYTGGSRATRASPPRSRRPRGGRATSCCSSADEYTGRRRGGQYSNETAALYATSCLDAPAPRDASPACSSSRDAGRRPRRTSARRRPGSVCRAPSGPRRRRARSRRSTRRRAADRRRRHDRRSRRRRTRGRRHSRSELEPAVSSRTTATGHTAYGAATRASTAHVDHYLVDAARSRGRGTRLASDSLGRDRATAS